MISSLILIFFSSFFIYLSHPNFCIVSGIWLFAWFAYVPVLLSIKKLSLKFSFPAGFFSGFLTYFFLCHWLISYNLWAGLSVYFLFGIYFGILFVLLKLSEKSPYRFWLRILFLFALEFLSTKGYLGFSYGVSAYSQWKNPLLVQSAAFFGIWGLDFVIILANCLIAEFFELKKENLTKKIIPYGAAFTVCFVILLSSSFFVRNNEGTDKAGFVLIQNCSNPWKNGIDEYIEEVENLKILTDQALKHNPDAEYVVWPETAVVVDILNHYEKNIEPKRHKMAVELVDYFESKKQSFIFGTNYKDYNSVVLYSKNSKNKIQIYSKNHLVPFSEDFPCKKLLKPVYNKMLDARNVFWESGDKIIPLRDNRLSMGTPVCFEDTFTNPVKAMRKQGAELIVNLSNDFWSNSEPCQMQHLAVAVFRSAENGIPSVRCTNSGQTCYINNRGKVVDMLEPFTQNWLYCEVKLNRVKSKYVSGK